MGFLRAARRLLLLVALLASAPVAAQTPDEDGAEPPAEAPFGPEPSSEDELLPEDGSELGDYEPDQRGVIPEGEGAPDQEGEVAADDEPLSAPAESDEEEIVVTGSRIKRTSYSGPGAVEVFSRKELRSVRGSRARSQNLVYLELQLGALFAQPPARDGLQPGPARGGLQLGAAAGLHLSLFELGLRYSHGVLVRGTSVDTLALDARYSLSREGLRPQLRLGVGPAWLGGLDGGDLSGLQLDLGLGGSLPIGESLTLGAGIDAGLLLLGDSADTDAGQLKLHLDLGYHF